MIPNSSLPWDAVRVSLLWAYEGSPRSVRSSFCDRAFYLTAWLVLRGGARVTHDGATFLARRGEWLFPRPVPRFQEFEPGTRLLSLALQAEWPDGRCLFDEGLSLVLPAARHPALTPRARALCRLVERREGLEGHFAFHQALHGWARVLCAALEGAGLNPRRLAPGGERVAEMLRLLEACPLDERHPAPRIARALGLGRVQFERLCTGALGQTSRQYLEARRLDYARRALPIKLAKEVAAETGFRHVSTFSAWYKRKTGHPPTLPA